ncbi:MAG: hypothetical protein KDD69_15760 [Bdellovibrionales bacterium]|nr:hypothetical protein [Bdellovibrionales bacterium]
MREQQAVELFEYVCDRVAPGYEPHVKQPMVLRLSEDTLDGGEHIVLVPIDGARRARALFARFASELGQPQQVAFPHDGSGISCGISTIAPSQYGLKANDGLLWGISIGSNCWLDLPAVEPIEIDDLLSVEPECETDGADGGSVENPYFFELVELAKLVAKEVVDKRRSADIKVGSWTMVYREANAHIQVVALLGFDTPCAASRCAEEVVEAVGRVNMVTLIDLRSRQLSHDDSWEGNYALLLVERVSRRSSD